MTEEIISMEEYVAKEKIQLMTNFIRSFIRTADSQSKSVHGYGPNYEKVVLRSVTIQIA